MTDRFDAQLRQHLLETADVRSADHQLERVIDGVAVTTQRRSLPARLSWGPGRIGPVSPAAVRYGLIAGALALAAIGGATLAGGTPRPSTVFEGTWITIDPVDGSGMTLVVGPGPTPAVYFEDGYASGVACVDDAGKRFTARGTGEISADRLEVTYPDGGGCGLQTVDIGGVYRHDSGDDALTDEDGIVWTRALGDPPERPALETPAASPSAPEGPTASPPGSPPPADATFDSARHGISIDHPDGWQTRPATEPWTGGPLAFDSPGADVIVDPVHGDGLYLVIASRPYGDLSEDAWRDEEFASLCTGGAAFGFATVDGSDALVVSCGSDQGTLIATETRGYLIRLVVPSDDPTLAATYDGDWFSQLLDTVRLHPDDAVDASLAVPSATAAPTESLAVTTPTPDPDCIQFDAPGTYTAPVGPLALTVSMPGSVAEPWIGDRGGFDVLRAACTDYQGRGRIDAGVATMVDTTACTGGRTAVQSTAEAIAAVSVAAGFDVLDRSDVTIDGYAGSRFDLMAEDAANGCPDQQIPLVDGMNPIDRGVGVRLYLIDVDGTTLAVGLFGYPEADPALRTAIDEIVASMQIEP